MTFTIARRAALLGLASLAAATTVSAGLFSGNMPSELDLALERSTESGLYSAVLAPVSAPVRVGAMHAWTVTLTDAKGRAVDGADIAVDGGMPQHGHGLPTAPAVTKRLEHGQYLIEGMKFNMPGWWKIELTISGPAGADIATFNLMI